MLENIVWHHCHSHLPVFAHYASQHGQQLTTRQFTFCTLWPLYITMTSCRMSASDILPLLLAKITLILNIEQCILYAAIMRNWGYDVIFACLLNYGLPQHILVRHFPIMKRVIYGKGPSSVFFICFGFLPCGSNNGYGTSMLSLSSVCILTG